MMLGLYLQLYLHAVHALKGFLLLNRLDLGGLVRINGAKGRLRMKDVDRLGGVDGLQ
jgi:hypothetical protein